MNCVGSNNMATTTIRFLHQVCSGPSELQTGYGIQMAEMCGFPNELLAEARKFQRTARNLFPVLLDSSSMNSQSSRITELLQKLLVLRNSSLDEQNLLDYLSRLRSKVTAEMEQEICNIEIDYNNMSNNNNSNSNSNSNNNCSSSSNNNNHDDFDKMNPFSNSDRTTNCFHSLEVTAEGPNAEEWKDKGSSSCPDFNEHHDDNCEQVKTVVCAVAKENCVCPHHAPTTTTTAITVLSPSQDKSLELRSGGETTSIELIEHFRKEQ